MLLDDGKCEVVNYNDITTFPYHYRSDLDVTEELCTDFFGWYLQLGGFLILSIELYGIYIFHETSLLL